MSLPAQQEGSNEPLRDRLGATAWKHRTRGETGEAKKPPATIGERLLHSLPVYKALYLALRVSGLLNRARREFLSLGVHRPVTTLPTLPRSFDGLRILQVTDLHLDVDWGVAERVKDLLQSTDCDLVAFTGDFVDNPDAIDQRFFSVMAGLTSALRAPAYAVLGNHDRLALVPPLEAQGIRFLLNENVRLARGGESIWLAGVDDPSGFAGDDLARARKNIPPSACTILLAHSPGIARQDAIRGIALTLAGHTHGGQICLPGGWGRTGGSEIPGDQRAGFWQRHGQWGYTCPGVGGSHFPLRLNCPPRISLHTLRRGPSSAHFLPEDSR